MRLAGWTMAASGEESALPLLRGGKVDFEDAQVGKRIAIGEGVEAGAENYVLRDALRDGLGQPVFSVAAARGHEGAEGARDAKFLADGIELKSRPKQRHSDGICEDAGRSRTWWTARSSATRRAVLLARPVSMFWSVIE